MAQAVERHHLLPRQFKKQFEDAGLNIEKFVVELPRDVHRLKPGGLHTGPNNWNKQWDAFFAQNANASRAQILNELDRLKKEFGLP